MDDGALDPTVLDMISMKDQLFAVYMDTGDIELLESVITLNNEVLEEIPKDHPHRARHLTGLVMCWDHKYRKTEVLSDLHQVILYAEEALEETPSIHPSRAYYLDNLSNSLNTRYLRTGFMDDLNQAISYGEEALAATPQQEHVDRAIILNCLYTKFHSRFDRTGLLADLHKVIIHAKELMEATLRDRRIAIWANLGRILGGARSDLEQAISSAKQTLTGMPDGHPGRAPILSNLSTNLYLKYQRTEAMDEIQQAISYAKQARTATPLNHPERASRVDNLKTLLDWRHRLDGTMYELGIMADEDALAAMPRGHPKRADRLSDLATKLHWRYEKTKDLDDLRRANSYDEEVLATIPEDERAGRLSGLKNRLDPRYQEAISYAKVVLEAMSQTHPERSPLLGSLGGTLFSRYQRIGDIDDLKQAISCFGEALKFQSSDRTGQLSDLSNLWYTLYMRTEAMDDLKQSTMYAEEALEGIPQDHPHRSLLLNNQALRSHHKYNITKAIDDHQQAIFYAKKALTTTPQESPLRADLLANLANILGSKYDQTHDMDDLKQAIPYAREALAAIPQNHPGRISHLNRLAMQLHWRYERTATIEDLIQAISYYEEALVLVREDGLYRADCLSGLARGLFSRYQRIGDVDDVNRAVSYCGEAIETTPPGDPKRGTFLVMLAKGFDNKYRWAGAIDDLRQSILYGEEALLEIPLGDRVRAPLLFVLSRTLDSIYKEVGAIEDLQQAVSYAKEALEETPQDDPELPERLEQSKDLESRYKGIGTVSELQRAISRDKEALADTPKTHPDRNRLVQSLVSNMELMQQQTRVVENLEQFILYSSERLAAIPQDNPHRFGYSNDLATLFLLKYNQTEAMEDLQRAIFYTGEALAGTQLTQDHCGRSLFLKSQAIHLYHRYERTKDMDDLQQAISYAEEILDTAPPNHPHRVSCLDILANCFRSRYERTGDMSDVNREILLREEVLTATPSGPGPDRFRRLRGLSEGLSIRFERTGAMDDLNRAIWLAEEGIEVPQASHYNLMSRLLSWRFEQIGDSIDLDQAIEYAWRALEGTPEETSEYERAGYLTNLANRLHKKYDRDQDLDGLEYTISICEQALDSVPEEHPDRVGHLQNMAVQYGLLYRKTGSVDALEKAVLYCEQGLARIPQGRPDRGPHLLNLSSFLGQRYNEAGPIDDLQRAILYAEEASEAFPLNHPGRDIALLTVGPNYLERYRKTGSPEDFTKSMFAFKKAWNCSTLRPALRIMAAQEAAKALFFHPGGVEESSSLLEGAVLLLPKVSPRSLERFDMMYMLVNLHGVAAEAASSALEAGRTAYDAMKLLELGRGIMISFAIDYRGDLPDLKETNSKLFNKFDNLRVEIDIPLGELMAAHHKGRELEALRRRREAVDEMEDIIAEIRKLPGHEGFQLPLSPGGLMSMAKDGPIVTFSSSIFRSDAIIITSSKITSIPLPKLVFSEVNDRLGDGAIAKLTSGTFRTYSSRNKKLREFLFWLWDVAVGPVIHELKFTAKPEADAADLPHIWWIGVGLLGVAPFHAAGDYSPGADPLQNTLSYAVSSYTPTIRALSYAREKDLTILNGGRDARLLLITMSTTPGGVDLPDVEEEVMGILEVTEGSVVATRLMQPSAMQVFEQFDSYGVMHFACHGISEDKNPSGSHLVLVQNGEANKLTVERISRRNTRTAQLAYLSACSTAESTPTELSDECLHIASGFQLAGFSHVLAAMWPSESRVCREVSTEFYRLLFNGKGEGHRKVGTAFHEAVKKVQEKYRRSPLKWAPFIHMGA
ncbi:hypothetical protein Q9L58_006824 [Maublancomyces gigas]|uniref:CHAT domain-containing protein n=1 Tax=Discina gigas TaxID=1032678 RepID=A0ABR3GFG2_9PEZI